MIRHASAEDLASLDLGGLKPRKAAKIQAHMATCAQCTELSSELAVVPATLASVSYPAMPESLSVQIESALATESAQRLAAAPPTEAGRRDLPERARHARRDQRRGSWQLPGMSVLATRIVAAAGALVVLGVGGYEIATHVPSNVTGTAASSSGSAAPGGQLSFGPSIQYGAPAAHKTVRAVNADTNFTSAKLGTQALAALQAARLSGALPAQRATGSAPSASAASANSSAGGTTMPGEGPLASCLGGIAGNQSVLLVETAKFEGRPATIIITAQTATSSQAEVWVVGPACTASHPDVLDHLRLSRT